MWIASKNRLPARLRGARKVVTVVFADLIGSTALHERLDAESVRRLMDRYYQALHMGASLSAAVPAAAIGVCCSEGNGSHLFLPTFAHEHMVTCPAYPPHPPARYPPYPLSAASSKARRKACRP